MRSDKELKLSKKDIWLASWRWIFFALSTQNYEYMMGTGFAHSLSGSLEKLYEHDQVGLSKALKRHVTFFNTEPQLGSIIPGIILSLEEEYANNQDNQEPSAILQTKNVLMGPIASLGDSFLVGMVNPILLSIAIGLSANGSLLGLIVFLILWIVLVIFIRHFLFIKGYLLGLDAIKILKNEKIKNKIVQVVTVFGLIVIGGATVVTSEVITSTQFLFDKNGMTMQKIMEQPMFGFISIFILLTYYFFLSKKKWSFVRLVCASLLAVAIILLFQIL